VLLKGLVERGHRVTAFSPSATPAQSQEALEWFPPGGYDLRCYPHPPRRALDRAGTFLKPFSWLFSPQLLSDVEQQVQAGVDLLHLENVWAGWAALRYADRAILHVHRLHQIDASDGRRLRIGQRFARASVLAAERAMLRRFRTITASTLLLAGEISQLHPAANVRAVPTALELPLYPFQHQESADRPPIVGLVGSFDQSPSYQAAVRLITRLWPFLKQRLPQAQLCIMGKSAQSALSRWCGGQDIRLDDGPPDAFWPYSQIDVMLYAPNAASGVKIEVLEAFALGTAVVTNWAGVEGLDALDGVHAGICDYDEGLVDRAVKLLEDRITRRWRAVAAWQLVHSHANPDQAIRAVEAAHEWLLAEPYPLPAAPSQPSTLAAAG
jgi:glycosyltransferase involved in cell wall biosynthesis